MAPPPKKSLAWLNPAVAAMSGVPALVLALAAVFGGLGPKPVDRALNQLGLFSLVGLLVTLACTPIKIATGWTWPIRIRRTLGLATFAYACVHLSAYVTLDQQLSWSQLREHTLKHPFTFVGLAAFVLLIPLAVTSTDRMVRRLGYVRWKRLHRLVYLAAALGVVHFIWRVKKDRTVPYLFAVALVLLLGARLLDSFRRQAKARG